MLGGPESPRPKEYQVEASKEIVTKNVTEIMKGQLGKQEGIGAVAIAALNSMSTADTKAKVEGITNIVANTANAIQEADGSAKLLSTLTGSTTKGIAEMSAVEYLAYSAGQTIVASGNREKVASGVKLGMEKIQQIAGIAGAGTGIGGLIALGVSTILRGRDSTRKKSLLNVTGSTIDKFTIENPEAGKILKAMIAKATSSLPVDAKKEFNI